MPDTAISAAAIMISLLAIGLNIYLLRKNGFWG